MLGKVLVERNSGRKFERASRWNSVEYTIVSRKNRFAEFADNYNSDSDKLNMTWFKINNVMIPLNRFVRLDNNIILDDYSTITLHDPETHMFLEFNKDRSKVRLYNEVA